jgi:aspartyl-tRNA(Asn)/glutamyl-tRNA(Gln) amidotransferase subunit A
MDPAALTLRDLRDAIASRRLTAEAAVRAALDRAHALNPALNAFIELHDDHALARAREIDAAIARGEGEGTVGPLAGVPIALKDNICLARGRTTAASRYLENYRSPFSATAAQRLEAAGAIIIGKTNLDEFAMGSSTERSAFGPTRNPWDPSRVPGGSSGGSAAAVAARIVPGALGSDTGGSIRQPAGWCNIVGVKPTYGRVSRWGLVAYASSLDQIGPMARTVADAALLLSVICGHDPLDATSLDTGEATHDFVSGLDAPPGPARVGVPRQVRDGAHHPAVAAALDRAVAALRDAGVEVVDADLTHALSDHAIAAYYIIAPAEASSNLARYDGVRYGRPPSPPVTSLDDLYTRARTEGLGDEVKRRIMLGTHALSSGYYDAYYTTALRVRRLIKADFDACFSGAKGPGPVDALLIPSSPHPPFRLGEKSADPLAMYLEDIYTVGVNLAGLPAVTVPAGFDDEGGGGPVGVQLVGPAMAEGRLLQLARLIERRLPFHERIPSLPTA